MHINILQTFFRDVDEAFDSTRFSANFFYKPHLVLGDDVRIV